MRTHDLHQHLWPEEFVAALRARRSPPFLDGTDLVTREGRFALDLSDHDPGERVTALDRDGIDVAVLSLQPSLGLALLDDAERDDLESAWLGGVGELVGSSEGRFLALSPTRHRDGFAGVCVGATSLLDLDRLAPTLDEIEQHGQLLFVHPDAGAPADSSKPSWWGWAVGYPSQMQAAYLAWLAGGRERWPHLRVLFAILAGGGPLQLERLAQRGLDVRSTLDPNVFIDVATYGRRAIELCIETFGVTQLAYGSDTPIVDAQSTLAAVRGFGDSVARILQIDTPTRLLP
jgi:hypothetical protein